MRRVLYPLVIVLTGCSTYLAAQSNPASAPAAIDPVIRASKLEITNAEGKVVFVVRASEKNDGELRLFDAKGATRLSLTMPHYSQPNVPGQTSPGITLTMFNEDNQAVFNFVSKNLTAGGDLLIGGGTGTSMGNIIMSADKKNGGHLLIHNERAYSSVKMFTHDNDGAGRISVTDRNGGHQNSLVPTP